MSDIVIMVRSTGGGTVMAKKSTCYTQVNLLVKVDPGLKHKDKVITLINLQASSRVTDAQRL